MTFAHNFLLKNLLASTNNCHNDTTLVHVVCVAYVMKMFCASHLTAVSGKILQNVSEIVSKMKFALNELRLYCELFIGYVTIKVTTTT